MRGLACHHPGAVCNSLVGRLTGSFGDCLRRKVPTLTQCDLGLAQQNRGRFTDAIRCMRHPELERRQMSAGEKLTH